MSRPVGECGIYFQRREDDGSAGNMGAMWIYFSARRGGMAPAGRCPHAETRLAGGPVQTAWDVTTDTVRALLAVERCAVDVAGLAIGLAGEAQDGGVVDEPIRDRDRLGGRREELGPLFEREIRHHHR